MIKLTPKQEKFCNKYVECGNASEAYRVAYDCSKMKDETVNKRASEMLNNGEITGRVNELQSELKNKSDITKEKVLNEFASIAFSSIACIYSTWIELKELDKLTEDQKKCIKSISTKVLKKNIGTSEKPEIVDVEYVKVEFYDKIKALENIGKMIGYYAPDKVDHTSNGDKMQVIVVSSQSAKEEQEKFMDKE